MPYSELSAEELRQLLSEADATISAQKEAADRLIHFEALAETVPVGVVMADAKGRIYHGNSLTEKMLRHPVRYSSDTHSYGEWVSFHEDGRQVESHEYPLARVIDDGLEISELDVNYRRGDGTMFWLRIIGRPVRGRDGTLLGATVALIDIDEEVRLRKQQDVLIAELDHRVKNAFTVVKSIVMQSLRRAHVPDTLRLSLEARLDAYAGAHARLVGADWERTTLGDLARQMVSHVPSRQITVSGPDITIASRKGLALSMAFYELATNALKYGSLSAPGGVVDLRWDLTGTGADQKILMHWSEHGGPPAVEPVETGFGSFVIDRALALETQGAIEMEFTEKGFRWRLEMPLAADWEVS